MSRQFGLMAPFRGPEATCSVAPSGSSSVECEDLIRDGAPIMTDVYPDGLEWWDGADAQERWAEISPMLVTRRLPSVHEGWVAHVWESENGDPVVHFDGWH
jgi:hypothetical protein